LLKETAHESLEFSLEFSFVSDPTWDLFHGLFWAGVYDDHWPSRHSSFDYYTASGNISNCRTDGILLSGSHGYRSSKLSVEEKRRRRQWCKLVRLLDTCNQ